MNQYASIQLTYDPKGNPQTLTLDRKVYILTAEIAEPQTPGNTTFIEVETDFDGDTIPIVIELQGGLIQDIRNLPDNLTIQVHDFDTENVPDSEITTLPPDGRRCVVTDHTNTPHTTGEPLS